MVEGRAGRFSQALQIAIFKFHSGHTSHDELSVQCCLCCASKPSPCTSNYADYGTVRGGGGPRGRGGGRGSAGGMGLDGKTGGGKGVQEGGERLGVCMLSAEQMWHLPGEGRHRRSTLARAAGVGTCVLPRLLPCKLLLTVTWWGLKGRACGPSWGKDVAYTQDVLLT